MNLTDHPCPPCTHKLTHTWESSTGDRGENHYCAHPTGAKPLVPECPWRTDGAMTRALSNRVFG